MKSLFAIPLFLFLCTTGVRTSAQVGIGTTNPSAQLDIRSSSQALPNNTDGVLIPRINNFPAINPTASQDGMMVYATGIGTPEKGFYYWSNGGSKWEAVGSKKVNDLVDAKSDNDGSFDGSSIFLGVDAGSNDFETNNQNVGIGFNSMFTNTSGSRNTAMGYSSLFSNNIGTNNTASGYNSLQNNIDGNSNSGIGSGALRKNTTGGYNTALGSQTLINNIDGSFNTANGFEALLKNTNGEFNTAMGSRALYNNVGGDYNTAVGNSALSALTSGGSGNDNTAIGNEALSGLTNGSNNTAVGTWALLNSTSGSNNIAMGYNAQVPNSNGSNQIQIGDSNISYAGIQVSWTTTSDRRWKDQIRTLPYGLNMISQLKPVDYIRKNNDSQTREIGFIAQDVKTLLEKLGYTDQGLLTIDDNGYMSLRYNDFIPVLVKAIQEQQKVIEKLQQEKAEFNLQFAEENTKASELEKRVEKLEAFLTPTALVKD